jgi:hypothetical protein
VIGDWWAGDTWPRKLPAEPEGASHSVWQFIRIWAPQIAAAMAFG